MSKIMGHAPPEALRKTFLTLPALGGQVGVLGLWLLHISLIWSVFTLFSSVYLISYAFYKYTFCCNFKHTEIIQENFHDEPNYVKTLFPNKAHSKVLHEYKIWAYLWRQTLTHYSLPSDVQIYVCPVCKIYSSYLTFPKVSNLKFKLVSKHHHQFKSPKSHLDHLNQQTETPWGKIPLHL